MRSSRGFRSGRSGRAVVVAAGMLVARTVSAQATLLSDGIEHLARHEIGAATQSFQRAAQDSNPQVRRAGERWLGRLDWLVRGNTRTAAIHLGRALTGAADSAPPLIERARLLDAQHRYREAAQAALDAMRAAKSDEVRGSAARTAILVASDGAFAAMAASRHAPDSIDDSVVRAALDTIGSRVKRFPGRTNDALAQITGGTLIGDRQAIEAGWSSYFRLIEEPLSDSLKSARQRIEETPSAEVGELVRGLMQSRLYEPAALLVARQRSRFHEPLPDRISDALEYGRFAHELRASVAMYYRRSLEGRARTGDLDRAMNAATRDLWNALRWDGPRPAYYPAAVPRELAKRFGAVISVDRGGAIPELHMAHAVGSHPTPVSAATATKVAPLLVVLDGVVDNGLDAWLLDGAAGRAGWSSADSIFEVRTAFTEAPFRAWTSLTDPEAKQAELERIARDSVSDLVRVRDDSSGYLPGVAARIFRNGAREILDSLSRGSLSVNERRDAFVDAMFEQLTQSTIALHESRHAADIRSAVPPSGVEGEFRAKIDEVMYASHPKLALTAILHPNIGDQSAHGRANRRVMLRLIKWIRANGSSIAGYDSSAPALLQLPLLTDAQLRAAFQSMRAAG